MITEEFQFPEIYIEMDQLGWLDTNHNNYLWVNDMEWYRCEEIQEYEYEDDELRNVVPFAHTGGGDKWGWYIEESGRMFVVLCYHDDYEGTVYAAKIEGAIFRSILEFLSNSYFYINPNEAKSYQYSAVEIREFLSDWRSRFHKWFEASWLRELDELLQMDLKLCRTKHGDYYALLTPEEANEKIVKYLNFDMLDQTIVWSN
ncbi:MAG: hypothetical protein K6T85_00340 [Gorillibacterium sp.]|nr:hypothetical protein [Gorillibacterium sp.]